jgi:hypothetical protein
MPQAPLAAKEGKEAPRRQVRNRSARGHRYTPNPKGSNPVSRDLAADACGEASRVLCGEKAAGLQLVWDLFNHAVRACRLGRQMPGTCGLGEAWR